MRSSLICVGFGSSIILDSGATTVGINNQESTYGQTEWLDDIHTIDASGENVQFILNGVQPANAVTKIYILTEVGGGTYTIQSNTNSADRLTILNITINSLQSVTSKYLGLMKSLKKSY